MGWLFTHGATRADIIQRCTRTQDNEHGRWTTLAHCTKGNVLWSVIEYHRKDAGTTENFIGCYLLARHAGFGWGYKDIDESMGPYYYSCPLSYLDMAPETNAGWREQVRAWHARLSRKVAVGDIWSLVHCKVRMVEIVSVRPLRGRGRHDGVLYRIPRKLLGEPQLASDLDSDPERLPAASTQALAA